MKRLVVVAIVSLLAGLVVGSWFATRRAVSVFVPMLEAGSLQGLNFELEELVWHRGGEAEKALRFAEQQLDGAILSIPHGRDLTSLPPEARSALATAKLCRRLFPFEQEASEARAVLEQVSLEALDPESRSLAARYLLGRNPKG